MTTWIRSEIAAVGPDADIERFRRLMFRTVRHRPLPTRRAHYEVVFDFAGIVPAPARLRGATARVWAAREWGSASNARCLELLTELAGVLEFAFSTCDSFPEPVFRALAAEFPSLIFDGRSSTPDGLTVAQGQFNGSNRWTRGRPEAGGRAP